MNTLKFLAIREFIHQCLKRAIISNYNNVGQTADSKRQFPVMPHVKSKEIRASLVTEAFLSFQLFPSLEEERASTYGKGQEE